MNVRLYRGIGIKSGAGFGPGDRTANRSEVFPQSLFDRPGEREHNDHRGRTVYSHDRIVEPDGRTFASSARMGLIVRLPGDVGPPMSPLPPRRGAYGFDAPYAPLLMVFGG